MYNIIKRTSIYEVNVCIWIFTVEDVFLAARIACLTVLAGDYSSKNKENMPW